jgi:hypothetical protein
MDCLLNSRSLMKEEGNDALLISTCMLRMEKALMH